MTDEVTQILGQREGISKDVDWSVETGNIYLLTLIFLIVADKKRDVGRMEFRNIRSRIPGLITRPGLCSLCFWDTCPDASGSVTLPDVPGSGLIATPRGSALPPVHCLGA